MRIESNVCNPEDPNYLYTYIVLKLFSPKIPANEFCKNKMNEFMTDMANNNEINKEDAMIYTDSYIRISYAMGLYSGMPLKTDYLYFDENFLQKIWMMLLII